MLKFVGSWLSLVNFAVIRLAVTTPLTEFTLFVLLLELLMHVGLLQLLTCRPVALLLFLLLWQASMLLLSARSLLRLQQVAVKGHHSFVAQTLSILLAARVTQLWSSIIRLQHMRRPLLVLSVLILVQRQ